MKHYLLLFFLLFSFFSHFAEAKNVENEYLVKYRGLTSDVMGAKSLGLDSLMIKSFFIGKEKRASILKEFSELSILHVYLEPEVKAKFVEKEKLLIDYIESNRILYVTGKPIKELPAIPKAQWGLEAMDALKAWTISLGSPEVIVGVIDSGVDYYHYALKNSMWNNQDGSHGWDFVDNSNLPYDENGHGTHCAGVIAANSKEFMGIAPNVKIMALRFIGNDGSGSTDGAIGAIYYGVKHGAKVLSNSWGGSGYQKSLYDAIAYANTNKVLFVAAAGNEYNNNDRNLSYPASYKLDNVISVGAMDINKKKASFSNYGKKTVHIFAAGVDVYSTVPNDKGQYMSGTSMATPMVAGVAALAYSKNKGMTPIEAKELILDNAVKVRGLESYCTTGGMVSAYKVLKD